MSLVFVLILGAIAALAAISLRLLTRRRFRALALLLSVCLILIGLVLRPVCRPISEEQARTYTPPIEQRTERGFLFRTYQRRNGQWFHCETWIARLFFG